MSNIKRRLDPQYSPSLSIYSVNFKTINPNVAKVGGLQSQGDWGWSSSTLLRSLSNDESEVLRLSRRGNNKAKSIPSFKYTNGDIFELFRSKHNFK